MYVISVDRQAGLSRLVTSASVTPVYPVHSGVASGEWRGSLVVGAVSGGPLTTEYTCEAEEASWTIMSIISITKMTFIIGETITTFCLRHNYNLTFHSLQTFACTLSLPSDIVS